VLENAERKLSKELKIKSREVKEFNNWMSPKGLPQLIQNHNDRQKQAVKDVWLVCNFDTCSHSLPSPLAG